MSYSKVKLGDVVEILDNRRIPVNAKERARRNHESSRRYPYYGATGQVGQIDDFIFEGEYVLLGEDGAPFLDPYKSKAYCVDGRFWVNNHAHILKSQNNKYIAYALNSVDYRDHVTGTTRLKLNQSALKRIELPYPDAVTQEKIVAKIEELFSDLDNNTRILEDELSHCDLLRASIIEHAFGKASTKTVKLSEVTDVITDGDHQAPPKSEAGVPFIVISNIVDNRVALERSTRYVPEAYYDSLKDSKKARSGDVLYTVTGSFGIPALIENDDKFCFQRHIALLRPTAEVISSKYLFYALQTDSVRKQATNIATGTAQLTVPLTGLRRISIPLIPLSKQQELVEGLELRLSELEGMMTSIRDSKLLTKKMKQSILSKAFKGELV